MLRFRFLALFLGLSVLCGVGFAQDLQNDTGVRPNRSYIQDTETVSTATGDSIITVPLVSLPGRAGNILSLNMNFTSQLWSPIEQTYPCSPPGTYNGPPPQGTCTTFSWSYRGYTGLIGLPGITVGGGALPGTNNDITCYYAPTLALPNAGTYSFQRAIYGCSFTEGKADPADSTNPVVLDDQNAGIIFDGTDLNHPTFKMPDGSMYIDVKGPTQTTEIDYVDKNGNKTTYVSSYVGETSTDQTLITDSLGRTITVLSNSDGSGSVSYPGPGKTTLTATISAPQPIAGSSEVCSLNDISQNANSSGNVSNDMNEGTANVNPTETDKQSYIQLANGATYTLRYDGCGRVSLITYPNGGYTEYSYSGVVRPYYFAPSEAYSEVSAVLHTLSEKDQCTSAVVAWGTTTTPTPSSLSCPSGINKTTYTTTIGSFGDGASINMSVVTPDQVTTTHLNTSYWEDMTSYGNGTTCCTANPVEVSTSTGSGTATKQVVTTLDTDGVHPKSVLTTLGDGSQSQVTYTNQQSSLTYNGAALLTGGQDSQLWDVQKMQEYDYAQGSPGGLIRTTNYTWNTSGYTSGPGYFAHQKTSEMLYGPGSTTPAAQTRYEYDNYSHVNSGLQPSGAVQHGDVTLGSTTYSYNSGFTARNNQTNVSRWRNTDGVWLNNYSNYDDAGNLLLLQSPAGNTTTLAYTDSWGDGACAPSSGQTKAYLTSVTNALNQTSSTTFNSCSGTQSAASDVNGQVTRTQYDTLNRVTQVTYPDSGSIKTCYSETGGSGCSQSDTVPLQQTVTMAINASQNKVQMYVLDGLDRVTQSQVTSDPSGIDFTDTSYDNMGRLYCVSNPYRSTSDQTYGTTCQTYDPLSRPLLKTEQDGSTVNWMYQGTTTAITNERGFKHSFTVDAAGRLAQVEEPDTNSSDSTYGQAVVPTDYAYDVLNDLTCSEQTGQVTGTGCGAAPSSDATSPWRIRRFSYDSLSELASSSNPENGLISYSYDLDGDLITRTDARGVITTYSYDGLHRPTQKSYPNDPTHTPVVKYYYDTPQTGTPVGWTFVDQTSPKWTNVSQNYLVGRISAESNTYSTILYSYDQLGRTTLKSVCTPSTCSSVCTPSTCGSDHYDMHYKYDLAGDTTFADRGLDAMKNNASPNSGYYYGGLSMGYNNAAQLLSATADIVDGNHPAGILSSLSYTPLGGVYTAELGSQYGQASYYDPRGRLMSRGSVNLAGQTVLADTWTYDKASNVIQTNDSAQGYFNYTYDPLNRVTMGSTSSESTNYGYDAWGNQTYHSVTAGSNYQWAFTPSLKNQATLTGASYDAAGDMTSDGLHNYTYDGENRLLAVTDQGVQYDYDPDGMRVATTIGGAVTAEYLYDSNSTLVTTVTSNALLVRAILRASETHWGDYTSGTGSGGGDTEFRLVNQVGTLVANGDSNGNYVEGCLSGPYGDAQDCTPGYDYTETHFSDKLRDEKTNNDYFGARYYSSALGRFLSADDGSAQSPLDPQTWNLYSYAHNNPLNRVDPDGRADGSVTCGFAADNVQACAQQGYEAQDASTPCDLLQGCSGGPGISIIGVAEIPDPSNEFGTYLSPEALSIYSHAGITSLATASSNLSAPSKGTCFVQGLKSGAVGAVAVAGVTAAAGLVLAPEVVTGALLAGAAYGLVQTGFSVYNNYQSGNQAGLAYNAGSVVGGLLGGGATSFGARFAITGETSLPTSIGDFFGKGKGIDFGRPGQSPLAAIRAAFSKGPDLGGGAVAIGLGGAGTASGCH